MNIKLAEAVKPFCEKLQSVIENGHEIAVITHMDADGITLRALAQGTALELSLI
jgi:single-stranded DNA-specific DHH superfamily exonuclease